MRPSVGGAYCTLKRRILSMWATGLCRRPRGLSVYSASVCETWGRVDRCEGDGIAEIHRPHAVMHRNGPGGPQHDRQHGFAH
eukprot:scaffold107097_cov38-Phaeocystis_antarctica.AAC.1